MIPFVLSRRRAESGRPSLASWMRPALRGMLAGAVTMVSACIDTPVMHDTLMSGVRMQFVANGSNDADVRIAHRSRTGDSLVVLTRQRVRLDSTVREVTVPLDITDCLRAFPGGCPLRVDVFLLVDRTVADSAGVGPVLATGAGVLEVPLISFRAATRLIALEPLLRPRVNDVSQVVVYGIDSRGDTLRGRSVKLTSADTTVATVFEGTKVRTLRVGTTTVTAEREGLRVPITIDVTPVRSLSVAAPAGPLYESSRDSVRASIVVENGFSNGVRWRSSDTTVVQVNDAGQLAGRRRGTATLTAVATADTLQRANTVVTIAPFQAAVRWDLVRTHPAPAFTGYAVDVWGTSMQNVWIAINGSRPYRFDGTSYLLDQTSQPGILGIFGASATDVWGVGSNIQRYDGQRWSTNAFRPARTLSSVWASGSRAWAVGDSGYIVTFDGSAWSAMTSPTTQPLKRIWGRSATEIYAVGAAGTILRFDGTRWSTMASGVRDTLFALAGDDQVVYAGGWSVDSLGVETQSVLQLSGGAWQRLSGGPGWRVYGIWRTDALGWMVTGNFGMFDRIVGGTVVPGSVEPDIPDRTAVIGALGFGFRDGAILAGFEGLAMRVSPTGRLSLQHLEVRYQGMCMDQRGHVLAGGPLGRVDRYDGRTWRTDSAGSRFINSIWCGATTTGAMAVGAFGDVHRFDGTRWVAQATPSASNFLNSAWGSSENDVFVGGDNGVILRWNGSTWSGGPGTIPGMNVYGVYGFGSNDVFAVGNGGRIRRFNGSSWQTMASPVSVTLRSVWGSSPTDVWAVGDRQTVLRFDGQSWRQLTRPDTAFGEFKAVWGSGPDDVYIGGCGASSTPVIRWNGSRFAAVSNTGCAFSVVGSNTGGVLFGEIFRSVRRGFAPNGSALVQPRSP